MNSERVPEFLDRLAEFLPSYQVRPGQKQMAEAVAQAIEDGENLVVEGGTGIGKSMAYLVPALLSVTQTGARVLIATSHKPLQDQIAKKDLPMLAKLFKKAKQGEFTWTTLKGISNYLCWNSAEIEQERVVVDPMAHRVINYAVTAGEEFSGDFEDVPFAIPPETRGLLSADSEDCLGARCPHRSRCYGLKMRRLAEETDVVVTNHSLLSLDIRAEGAVIPGDYATYIIDEGHNFEDNATKANGLVVTLGAVRRFLNSEPVRDKAKTSSAHIEEVRKQLERLQAEINRLWAAQKGDAEDENKLLLKAELPAGRQLADGIKNVLALLKGSIGKTEEEESKRQRTMKQGVALVDRLEKISAMADPNLVYFVERTFFGGGRGAAVPSGFSLNAMPIDVSGYLEKWLEENTVVFTSATLSDGQNFDFFIKRVGLTQPRTLIVPSPFNYPDNIRLFFPKPHPAGQSGFFNGLAAQIGDLLKANRGHRSLVLFTSHMAMEQVYRRLAGSSEYSLPDRPLFKQGDSQMQRIIGDFMATSDGVIFGTRSWWQGVDLPGMRLVILDKLPFPQMNDPVTKARNEDLEARGKSSFNEFMMPLAIITFRQGFGRLMRQESDRGVVVVCDDRIVRQRYGQRFIKSLPVGLKVLGSLDEVKQFCNT